jgi:hypothetical protein
LKDEPDEPHVIAGRKHVAGKIEGEEILSERFIHKVLVRNTDAAKKHQLSQLAEERSEHELVMLGSKGIIKARDLWADDSIAPQIRPKGASSNPIPLKEKVLGPGASYNPEAEAHQEAVAEAVAKALLRQRRRDDILSSVRGEGHVERDIHDPDDDDDTYIDKATWEKAIKDATPSLIVSATSNVNTIMDINSKDNDIDDGTIKASTKVTSRATAKWDKLKKKHSEVSAQGGKRMVEMAKFDASLEEAKALVGDDGRLLSSLEVKPEVVRRQAAILGRKEASLALHSTHEPVMVPLSDDLRGSLRTIKPVTAAGLVLDRMADMEATGRAHKRKTAHAAVQLAVSGEVQITVKNKWQLDKIKGRGKPYKAIEFPRRRGFGPADIIKEDVEREMAGLPPKKR